MNENETFFQTADTGEDLTAAIERLAGASVLVVGDLMLDRYVHGAVARISPEAPIPVLSVSGHSSALGGAGNVINNLSTLGVQSTLIALVGDDDAGREVRNLLDSVSGLTQRLHTCEARPTTVKTRFLAAGQQLLRADEEDVTPVPEKTADEVLEDIRDVIKGCGAVVLSDYGKGCLSDGIIRQIVDACALRDIPVLADPKGRDFGRYAGVDFITPNRAELSLATNLPTETDDEILAASRSVIERSGVNGVLATRSEHGMSLITSQAALHVPAQAKEVFDVVGAGDTVIAILAAGLASGTPLAASVALANLGGGVVVSKTGTATVDPAELLAASHGATRQESGHKVHTPASAQHLAQRWKQDGLKVGFTNGCFDLLHPGHIHLLQQSRAQCDRLVVGLNSDESVQRLKGPDRPVQNEMGRATVLASLESVDAVVVFGEDTPIDLIRTVRPNVLIKGSDYTKETVVGAQDVESWGGRVFLADLLDGHSTTNTVGKLKRA